MTIDLYNIIKNAVKDALQEHQEQYKDKNDIINTNLENSSLLLTVKQFCEKYTFISQSGIRALIFNCEYNGFNVAFSRIGSKILIEEQKALEWFKNPPPESKATCYQGPDKKTIYKYKK